MPNRTAETASIISDPPPTPRSARRRTREQRLRRCAARARRRRPSPTSAAAPRPSVCVDAQPALSACEAANTSAPRLSVASSAPRRSRPRHRGCAESAGTTCSAPAASASPTGRLMRKIRRQSTSSVRVPPSSTPKAAPAPPTAPQAPSALARSPPWVKAAMMIESAAGESIAAPRPWPARAANSVAAPPASAEASDESVKTLRPARNTRRRPSRSAARPPSSSRLPKISE